MARRPQATDDRSADREFLALENVSIRSGADVVFKQTNWTWRWGEQWAMLGPDGAGKSVLIEALLGRCPIVSGEVRGPFSRTDPENPEAGAGMEMAHLSPWTQRELALRESAFYQQRWHSGFESSPRTVAQFLSQRSVEERNPFELGGRQGNSPQFARWRRQYVDWLGIKPLLRRRLIHLSNGELRKTLLAYTLLKGPRLLILEDPYAGLDVASRRKLASVIGRLMQAGQAILVATHRVEEIPVRCTHLLLVDRHQVVGQGPVASMRDLWRQRGGSRAPVNARAAKSPLPPHPIRGQTFSPRPLVELRKVTIVGAGKRILHEINWTLREGECWALLGPNGAGKTTLLNLIQGDHPQVYAAAIRLFGRATDSTQALWLARRRIGWMSPELHQHYPAAWETLDVICSGYFNSAGLHQACSHRQRVQAREWLAKFGLERQAHLPFGELSFGQQRLVLLARAAVKRPRLIILDEPCQGLDTQQRQTLLAAVDRTIRQTGASLIFVSHHEDELPRSITHVLRLKGGRIREAREVVAPRNSPAPDWPSGGDAPNGHL